MLSGLFCLLAIAAPAPASPPVLRAVSATETAPVFAVGDVVTIAIDDANLRADGSTNQKAIGTLPFGAVVKIVEAAPAPVTIGLLTQRWYRVETVAKTKAKPASGWVFGNTVTTLGDKRFSVTLSAEGRPVVRFFRPGQDPKVASVDLKDSASTVSAVVTIPLADRIGLLVRSCGAAGKSCTDSLVGQGPYQAVVLETVSAPATPLSSTASKAVTVTTDGFALNGRAFSIYPLQDQLRPGPDENRLIDIFASDCHAVIQVDAHAMFDAIEQMPMCLVRSFEQNCAPDPCWDEQESCLDGCGSSCTSCDAVCADGCDSCTAACTTPACKRACAKKRAGCFTGCVKGADTCRDSGGCERRYATCTAEHQRRVDTECDRDACEAWGSCSSGDCKTTLNEFCQTACYRQ